MRITVTLILGALFAGGTAYAAEQRPFEKLDANSDGKLTEAEFLRGIKDENLERMRRIFDNRDKDSDGYLTLEEFTVPGKKERDTK